MWMSKEVFLLFSTIYLFHQPGSFDHCMQIHASTDCMDDKRDSRQGLGVRRVTLSTRIETENQLVGRLTTEEIPSVVPSYGFQSWEK
jgi:hypothetical protein